MESFVYRIKCEGKYIALPWEELGCNVRCVAEHGSTEGPLDREAFDEERRDEDAGNDEGSVYRRQRNSSEPFSCVYRTL